MNCPKCESPNRPGAQRCKRCADALPKNCHGCGSPFSTDGDLCRDCRTERIPAALGVEDLLEETDFLDPTPTFSLSPRFVGRAPTLDRLAKRFALTTSASELSFVGVIGPPGSGKSRLIREFSENALAARPELKILATEAVGPTEPPYAPFIRLLSARFQVESDDAPEVARNKIHASVASVLPAPRVLEVTHLLAHLLGAPFAGSPVVEPLAESPHQLEARTFIALRRFFAADAEKSPLLIAIDDLERAGTESVNLVSYLTAGLANSRVVMCIGARPTLFELHPTFGEGEPTMDRVDLGQLSPDDAEALFREILKPVRDTVPHKLIEHVRSHLDAFPRSVLEMVRLLLESEILVHKGENFVLEESKLASLQLPTTHEELLAARLRAMAHGERDLLEKAAACGETAFWLDAVVALVRAVALGDDPDGPTLGEIAVAGDKTRIATAEAFARLVEREIVVENPHSSIPGEREFRFAYPALWDLVYSGVDGSSGINEQARRRYHRLIAQWLELRPTGRGEEAQEEVGRHLERAGDGESAATRYRRAGDAARARYYNEKAIRLYANALQCLGEGDLAARIHLWHDLGSVYAMRGDYEAALGAFERMLRLSWVVASRSKGAVAFNKMGRVWRQKGDLHLALEYLQRGRELFEQADDERGIAGSMDDIAQVQWMLGQTEEALAVSKRALEMRRALGDQRSIGLSLSNVGNILKDRGLYEEAALHYSEALQIRRQIDDKVGVGTSLNNLGVLALDRADRATARMHWEEALLVAEEIGALPLQALVLNNLGEVALEEGKLPEAQRRLEQTLTLARELEDRRLSSEATRNLGMLELRAGHFDRARELCTHALAIAEAAGIRDYVGRALVALGEVHAETLFDAGGGAPQEGAFSYFERGIALFRDTGNDAELSRALERFGRHQLERGESSSAKVLLIEARALRVRLGLVVSELDRMLRDLGA